MVVAAFYRQNRNMGDKNLEDGSIVNHIHRERNTTGDVLESGYQEKWAAVARPNQLCCSVLLWTCWPLNLLVNRFYFNTFGIRN